MIALKLRLLWRVLKDLLRLRYVYVVQDKHGVIGVSRTFRGAFDLMVSDVESEGTVSLNEFKIGENRDENLQRRKANLG